MNLCLNAHDAMPDGDTLTLETHNVTLDEEWGRAILGARLGCYVCLSMSDTGWGMSPEVQAHLFRAFLHHQRGGEGDEAGAGRGLWHRLGGLECLRCLVELDPQVKVLISTGCTAKSLAQELVTEGALGVVEKPSLLQDFAVAARTTLDKSRSTFL